MLPWAAALIALTALRLALCASLPLAPDEAYYFIWSQHLQAGYFDAPPMVALVIRAGTMLLGNSTLGIRLFGPILSALGSLLLWDAGEQLFPGRQVGLLAAAMLNATLMIGAGAIIMTPDTPLIFFWSAGIAALARLITSNNPRWWLAVGLAAGFALLAKYTAILFIVAVFVWLITQVPGRRQLSTPWPWVALLLALLIFSPDIYWNAQHGWVSYLKQGSRVAHFNPGRSLQFLGELLGGQFGLFTPILFALAITGVWQLGKAPSHTGHLLVWLTFVPGVVFLEHVLSGRVQANWPAILYPSACLAAAALPMAILRRWLRPGLALGFGLTALVYAQALAAPFPIPARADPTALQFSGWRALTRAAASHHPAFLTANDYATASALAYDAPAFVPVVGFSNQWNPRWRYFALPSARLEGAMGILVTHRLNTPCAHRLGMVWRRRGGQKVMRYLLCQVRATQPGVLLSK